MSSFGALDLARARVRWFLSVSAAHLPAAQRAAGQRTFRDIRVDGEEVEFSAGFADLHTESYREILTGRGHGLEAARPAVEMVHAIRTAAPRPSAQAAHPFCRLLD